MDIVALQLAKKYAADTMAGAGAIKGDKGDPGPAGPAGATGPQGDPGDTPYIGSNGNWWIGGADTGVSASGNHTPVPGPKGDPGEGVPAGGTAGQVLSKASGTDYDTRWENPPKSSSGIPVGLIAIWSGTADNVPSGWQLCDGTNGTPDLRDKFVLGAGDLHAVGETGGEEEITLTVEQMPSHSHDQRLPDGTKGTSITSAYVDIISGSITGRGWTVFHAEKTGGGQPHNNMPPYYALCYIMKVVAD